MIVTTPPIRNDRAGDGRYGALRGSRRHSGTDYAMLPGTGILSPERGIMGRYGFAYSDDLQWRITDFHGDSGRRYRYFYSEHAEFSTGDRVESGNVIATAQDITERYPDKGMVPHVHVEVYDSDETRLNPEKAL